LNDHGEDLVPLEDWQPSAYRSILSFTARFFHTCDSVGVHYIWLKTVGLIGNENVQVLDNVQSCDLGNELKETDEGSIASLPSLTESNLTWCTIGMRNFMIKRVPFRMF